MLKFNYESNLLFIKDFILNKHDLFRSLVRTISMFIHLFCDCAKWLWFNFTDFFSGRVTLTLEETMLAFH